MSFTMPNYPLLTPEQASPFGNVIQNALDAYMRTIEAKYKPLTTQAEAASKLAYAQLLGPQFIAKLMGNRDVLANISNPQALVNTIVNAGTNTAKGTGLGSTTSPNQLTQPSPLSSPSGSPYHKLIQEQLAKLSPEEQEKIKNEGQQIIPTLNPEQQNGYNNNQLKFYENIGRAKGLEEEGKVLGETRGKAIGDLDESYQKAVEASVPINDLIEIVKNPVFQNLRKYPGFQSLQLKAKANFGTPEEQELIGRFQATATKALAESVNSFRGRILDKEVVMANQMKISPSDNINMIMGKLPAIYEFNEFTKQRDRMAARLIESQHISRGDAIEKADKILQGNTFRKNVENELEQSQMVTIRNPKTGETITIPRSEARKGGLNNA